MMVQDWDSMDREMLYSRDNMEQASTSRGREVRVTIVIISEINIVIFKQSTNRARDHIVNKMVFSISVARTLRGNYALT